LKSRRGDFRVWRDADKPVTAGNVRSVAMRSLLARAKDTGGKLQPDAHDRNYGTYVINHLLPIEVFVDGSAGPRPCTRGRAYPNAKCIFI
jgi:hypothetical protein